MDKGRRRRAYGVEDRNIFAPSGMLSLSRDIKSVQRDEAAVAIEDFIKGEMVMGYATKDDHRKARPVWAKGDKKTYDTDGQNEMSVVNSQNFQH